MVVENSMVILIVYSEILIFKFFSICSFGGNSTLICYASSSRITPPPYTRSLKYHNRVSVLF